MTKCLDCGQPLRFKARIKADPTIGQHDDEAVYACVCGYEITVLAFLPGQNVNKSLSIHTDEKEILLGKVRSIVGGDIPGLRHALRVLAHPDVIDYTKRYFNAMDVNSMCTKYEAPWSCAREAEARYENIRFGFLGAASGIGFDESWCENCRKKVLNG